MITSIFIITNNVPEHGLTIVLSEITQYYNMKIDLQYAQIISHTTNSQDIFQSFCDDILHLDPKIRFVGVINDKGKLLAESKRKGLEIFIDPKELEILLMETALGVRMRREHDAQLGPVNFTISCNRNTMLIIFPFRNEMLCVSTEKEIELSKMPFTILQLLEIKIAKKD